jgi:hypothetical protein
MTGDGGEGEIEGGLTDMPLKRVRRNPCDRNETEDEGNAGHHRVVPEGTAEVKPVPDDPEPKREQDHVHRQ